MAKCEGDEKFVIVMAKCEGDEKIVIVMAKYEGDEKFVIVMAKLWLWWQKDKPELGNVDRVSVQLLGESSSRSWASIILSYIKHYVIH